MKYVVALLSTAMVIAALLSIPNAAAQEKQTLTADDFAGAIELTGNAGSLLSLTIPETVYRGLMRPNVEDIRVFDADGNPAPFLIRPVRGTVEQFPDREVPILAWNENTRRFSAPGVEINASGVAVTISGERGETGDNVYLADLSALEIPPSKLILDFEKNLHFNAILTIRSSDDLVQWKDYGKLQTAAFFDSPGANRNEFDIPRGRYLLLHFGGRIPAIESGSVRFDPAETPILGETHFTGTRSDDGKKVLYNTGGCFPVANIKFILSKPDSIKVVVRESRELPPDDKSWLWSKVGETVIFRIETPGKEPSLNVSFDTAGFSGPYWEIETQGEQVFTEVPVLSVIWETQELVFLARGQGPWILAYGNENSGPVSFMSAGEEEVFPAVITNTAYKLREKTADSGPRWKQIVLWVVLVLAAAALSAMAFYIIKSAKSEGQDDKSQ